MRHGNPHFHPDIREARRKVAAAKAELRRVVRRVQAGCPHPSAAHIEGRSSEYFGRSPATRICRCCGYEESYMWGGLTLFASGARTDRCGNPLNGGYSMPSLLADLPVVVTDDPNRYRPV